MSWPSRLRPRIVGIRPVVLVGLYGWRLRRHGVQELLAGGGIAIGVSLVFGVLLASTSITGSASQLLHGITGSARLVVMARSPEGFSERLANQIGEVPGVRIAAPLLRENATIVGPGGDELIQLVGVTASQIGLQATATRNLGAGAGQLSGGLGLPSAVADAIGAKTGRPVTLLINGEAHAVPVRVVLGPQRVGPVAFSPIAVALLPSAQKLSSERGRVTEVLVEPERGRGRQVRAELERLVAGRLDVQSTDHELGVLETTARLSNQSTDAFAAISAMVGFLLALNAMLLTVPERRRFVAELRMQGFAPAQVIVILVSQAVMLGLASSVIGVIAGGVVARTLFHEIPGYLTVAFPIGSAPVISSTDVLLALGCGVLATLMAASRPLLDLLPDRPVDGVLHETGGVGQSISKAMVFGFGLTGACVVVAVAVATLVDTRLSIVGTIILGPVALCLIPPLFALSIRLIRPFSERVRGSMLALTVIELDETATRSIALASVAALAIYGSSVLQGSRHDFLTGLNSSITEYLQTAEVWVTPDSDFVTVDSFRDARVRSAIAHASGVASVRVFQASLLDVGDRRMLIRGRSPADRPLIQASQLLKGNLAGATRLIAEGGWAAVSSEFAAERHLRIDGSFTLSTPSGTVRLGVAAITTNTGWPPGVITMNTADYSRYWRTTVPTALEVNFQPGVSPAAGRRAIQKALGSHPGLLVETFSERLAQYERDAKQGVQSLGEIATLILIAAVLAIVCALSANIWQRRSRLASLKAQGFDRGRLWRSLLLESGILFGIGGVDGALLGIYGHALADRYLRLSTGFSVPFSLGEVEILLTLMLITALVILVIALPGFAATNVPANVSFQE